MNLWKLLIKILKDERGSIGSQLLRYIGSKQRGDVPEYQQWANVPEMQQKLSENIMARIGQPREYQTQAAFQTTPPPIEAQTERILGQKLGTLPSAQDYRAQVEASKTQQISRAREREEERVAEEQEMYNRLGLVSSTPWMTRRGEIGEETEAGIRDIETGMDIYGLEYGLEADKLAEDIANMYLTQGQVLGGRQRGYQQFGMEMSMQDLLRQLQEEEMYGAQAYRYLGQGAVTPAQQYARDVAQWGQPTGWEYAAGGLEDTERLLLAALQADGGGSSPYYSPSGRIYGGMLGGQ